MKITLIVYTFPPKWIAGTEIASYNIAKYLARKGHEVHVITSLDKGLQENEIKDNFYIHRKINSKKNKYIGTVFFIFHIFLEIKKISPDIVHVQGITMGIPGLLAKIFFKKPYILWGRGSDIYRPNLFAKLVSKTLLKNATAVIALTQKMKGSIMNIYDRSIFVIPNGVDVKGIQEISMEVNRTYEKKTVLFVGTLRPVKGVKYVIEAMKIIKINDYDVRLLIIGDGNERDELENLVKKLDLYDCVEFVGQVSNNEIPKYMAKSDIFVLPSLSEGFPNVILEAMAVGLPIISSNVGGIPDIIEEGVNGLLIEPMNSEVIARKILFLLINEDLRKRMSMNNRLEVQKYSLENVVNNLESVYIQTINNHN